jgi:hypothetical protein
MLAKDISFYLRYKSNIPLTSIEESGLLDLYFGGFSVDDGVNLRLRLDFAGESRVGGHYIAVNDLELELM